MTRCCTSHATSAHCFVDLLSSQCIVFVGEVVEKLSYVSVLLVLGKGNSLTEPIELLAGLVTADFAITIRARRLRSMRTFGV